MQFTRRAHGSALFVNPLMAIYFTVDLDALAARSLYLDQLENTCGMRQVATRIERFRETTSTRLPAPFHTEPRASPEPALSATIESALIGMAGRRRRARPWPPVAFSAWGCTWSTSAP